MTKFLFNVMLCATVLVGGCGGGDEVLTPVDTATDNTTGSEGTDTVTTAEPVAVPVAAPAHVRMIQASPDAAAATVALYMDGAATASVPSLAYKAATAYADVPAGSHQCAMRAATAAADSAPMLQSAASELTAGVSYTMISHGLATGTPALAMASAADDGPTPDATHASLRFFHALVGVANVDICLPGATARAAGTPVFTNVAYGAFGAWASVPAVAAVTLQIRAANEATPCSGRQAGSVSITPTSGVWTAVAVGRATGRPAVAKELLLIADGASQVTTVAIR